MRVIHYINICCMTFLFSFSVAADKDAVPDDADSRARVAYQRGTELFVAEQYAAAAEAFREANRQKPSWKIQYNIAQAESAAKRYGLALQAFELFLAEGGDEVGVSRKDEVLTEIRRLREMVASVDVQGPNGADVYVDGVKRGRIPLEGLIKITAGKRHEIKVKMDGEILLERTVRLSGGDETSLEVREATPVEEAPPEPVTEVPAETTPTIVEGPLPEETADAEETTEATEESATQPAVKKDDGKKLRAAGAVMLGIGGAVAAFGGVMGVMSLSKTGEVKDLCGNETNQCNTKDGQDAYDAAQNYGGAANLFIPVGVVVAVTGLVLFLMGRKKKEKLTSFHLLPVADNSGGALLMTGSF